MATRSVALRSSEAFELQDGLIVCRAFQRYRWQEHAFGTRYRSPHPDVVLKQIHSDRVVCAPSSVAEGDALITDRLNLRIGVRTADCVPILLLDPSTRAVAAIHAGWRGTAAAIASGTVRKLQACISSRPHNLVVAIGPCIRACCYRVGPEVSNLFRSSQPYVDLAGVNRDHLIAAGVPPLHIFDSRLCTSCDPSLFHSYRSDASDPGRMISAIGRVA